MFSNTASFNVFITFDIGFFLVYVSVPYIYFNRGLKWRVK